MLANQAHLNSLPSRTSISLGSFIRRSPQQAAQEAINGHTVPVLGNLSAHILQICPQNIGVIDETLVERLQEAYPDMEIRFHANVQMQRNKILMDIIDFDEDLLYWRRLKEIVTFAKCRIYSAHAGFRKDTTLIELFEKQARLQDYLGIPVALEGHYPTRKNLFHLDSWDEWEASLKSGLPFVVDLSHAVIIATISRRRNDELITAMLNHPNCLEIHLSGNDGTADQHHELHGQEWWWPLLNSINASADVFYEGIFRFSPTPYQASRSERVITQSAA